MNRGSKFFGEDAECIVAMDEEDISIQQVIKFGDPWVRREVDPWRRQHQPGKPSTQYHVSPFRVF